MKNLKNILYVFICSLSVFLSFIPNIKIYAFTYTIPNGIYYIKNPYSGKYLDIQGAWTDINSPILQYGFSAQMNQQWKLVYQNDGTYKIYPMHTINMVMDVNPSAYFSGNGICIWSDLGYTSSRFAIQIAANTSSKYHNILTQNSNFSQCVDIRGGLSGDYINEWPINNTTNQQWLFEPCLTKLSNYKTFSAFDVGEASENQSELFRSKMVSMGFTNIGTQKNKNSNAYASAQNVKEIGLYSDVIYITGHAGAYTNMWFQNSAGSIMEYLCADSTVSSPSPKTGIGASFLNGSITKTNSYWDKKTKWGILGQCSQFNYGSQGSENHWNGLNNAQIWARTLLGQVHRMHGYLGYYGTAPGGEVHMDRLTKSLNSMNAGFNLVTSWFQGHDTIYGKTNYAMLYNNANYNDTMYSFTASQTPGISYAITLQRREGNTILPVPLRSSLHSQNINSISFSQSLDMNDFELRERTLSKTQKTAIESILNTSYYNKIEYNSDGGFEFQRESGIRKKVGFNEDTAIKMAKQNLSNADLLQDNNYRISVDYLVQRTLRTAFSDFSEPEIIQYNVYFYRTLNGYDILSDKDDGILISIDNDGVVHMKYLWRDIIPKSTIYNISSSTLANSKNEYGKTQTLTDKMVSTAYYYRDGNAIPIIVFDDDANYTNSKLVDAFTGKDVP